MVNKGKTSAVISLDPIHHRVRTGSVEVELQPLSFALFAKLLEHKNEIVPVAKLTDEVWGDVTVAPDTLKQRVFLLRKALEEAGIESCEVQSVRGKGYRLIVPEQIVPGQIVPDQIVSDDKAAGGSASGAAIIKKSWRRVAGISIMLALFAVYVWQASPPWAPPPNNRVVFWTVAADTPMAASTVNWEQLWITQLSSSDVIQFVESQRDPDQTLSSQGRQVRAAIISRWVRFESDGHAQLRMQIIETKTATSLRSDVVSADDNAQLSATITAQLAGIERIVQSRLLPLSREALNDSGHPAWDMLRDLGGDAAE